MRSLNQNVRNTKGRVVLQSDIVQDDSGSYEVGTEQRSWASQLTDAKVMGVKEDYQETQDKQRTQSAQAAVEEEWEKLEKIPAWNITKVRNKTELIAEARKKANRTLCLIEGSPSFEECRNRDKAPKKQRSGCTPQ